MIVFGGEGQHVIVIDIMGFQSKNNSLQIPTNTIYKSRESQHYWAVDIIVINNNTKRNTAGKVDTKSA